MGMFRCSPELQLIKFIVEYDCVIAGAAMPSMLVSRPLSPIQAKRPSKGFEQVARLAYAWGSYVNVRKVEIIH